MESHKDGCQSSMWKSKFHRIMLGLQTMPNNNLGTSPLELMLGFPLMVSREFVGHGLGQLVRELLSRIHDNVADIRPILAFPTTSVPTREFAVGDAVFLGNFQAEEIWMSGIVSLISGPVS